MTSFYHKYGIYIFGKGIEGNPFIIRFKIKMLIYKRIKILPIHITIIFLLKIYLIIISNKLLFILSVKYLQTFKNNFKNSTENKRNIILE